MNEAERSAAEAKESYAKACQTVGIAGKALDTEILDLVREVPQLFADALATIGGPRVAKFVDFYREYSKYMNETEAAQSLAYLEYANKNGDSLTEVVKLRLAKKEVPPELLQRDQQK